MKVTIKLKAAAKNPNKTDFPLGTNKAQVIKLGVTNAGACNPNRPQKHPPTKAPINIEMNGRFIRRLTPYNAGSVIPNKAENVAEKLVAFNVLFFVLIATAKAAPPSAMLAASPHTKKIGSNPCVANIWIINGIVALCVPVNTINGNNNALIPTAIHPHCCMALQAMNKILLIQIDIGPTAKIIIGATINKSSMETINTDKILGLTF